MSGCIWKNRADIYEWLSFGNCFLISSLAQMSKHKIDSSWSVKIDHSHKSWSTNIWNSNHVKKVKKKYLVYRWSDIMNRMQFLVTSSPWGNCNKDLTFIYWKTGTTKRLCTHFTVLSRWLEILAFYNEMHHNDMIQIKEHYSTD